MIKFRAWHNELGRMMSISDMWFNVDSLGEIGLNDSVMNDYITVSPDEIKLMQSTGLKDKNGKEIFEGDIVSIDTDEFDLLFVKYESCIYWLMDDEECVEHLSDYYKYVSIVGNIYENPELLEVEG
nr:MAG TPA: YopX protein [Caudoviricetes sp.]